MVFVKSSRSRAMDERAPDAHVGKRRELALVQRHVLVGVPGRPMNDDRGQPGELALLVPRHQRHDVHLAALQLVDARVGVRDELEHQPADTGRLVAAPVVGHALEQDVFASLPLRHPIRPGAERAAVVVLRPIDIAPLEQMLRQRAADELDVVRRVHLFVVDDRCQRVRCVHRADAVEPVGAFGVVVGTVDRVDRELHVGGREGMAVVPRHAGTERPRDVHAAIRTEPDASVLERRDVGREQRHHVHPLVGRRQALDDAGLDVFEDVRAEAIERVGFTVVADDEQIVGGWCSAIASGARDMADVTVTRPRRQA